MKSQKQQGMESNHCLNLISNRRMKNLIPFFIFLNFLIFSHPSPQTDKDKKEYIDKYLKIYDIETIVTPDSYVASNSAATTFAIKNMGNEIINRLEITIFYLDNDGSAFYEDDFIVIFNCSYGCLKELKPNYIWRDEPGDYFITQEVSLNDWSGEVKVGVKSISFKK